MKNPYILTFGLLSVVLASVQIRAAWSQESDTAPVTTPESKQTVSEEVLAPPSEEALEVVREARSRLFRHQTVQADLVQRVSLGDFSFEASGKYLAGEGFRSRIEYTVVLGGLEGVFLEVCDGQILHTRRQIGQRSTNGVSTATPQVELSRRDIQKILSETQLHIDQPEAVRAAEIGIGGLPAILASLERTMIFDAIQEEDMNGQPSIIVQGRWDAEAQEKLLAGLGGLAGQIQDFFPDRVRVTFAKESLFPSRFQYLKKVPNRPGSYRTMLTVGFENVSINGPIPVQMFNYISPPGLEERDETAEFIQAIQQAAAATTPKAETEPKDDVPVE